MNSDFQKRLFEYEETPAPRNWQKIITALEEGKWQSKLYHFERQPAFHNWEKIEAALHQQPAGKIIPFHVRYSKYLKYGAAAAILAIVLFTSHLVLEKKAEKQQTSTTLEQVPMKNSQSPVPVTPQTESVTENKQDDIRYVPDADVVVTKSQALTKIQKSRPVTKEKNYLDWINPQSLAGALFTPDFSDDVKDKIVHPDLSHADRFMIYCCDSYGQPVRVPKKMFDKMHCADNDAVCRENISCLQEKVSSVSISADFLGILQIIREVQENK